VGGQQYHPLGQLITFYIFFIGLSAGAIIISSLSYVFKKEIYEPIGRMAVFMGILLMVGAMSFVMVDLEGPKRRGGSSCYFYLNNMNLPLRHQLIFYTGYITLMLIYLWLIFEGKKTAGDPRLEPSTSSGPSPSIWGQGRSSD